MCEACYEQFRAGSMPHVNKLNPMVSKDVTAHSFVQHADGKSFTRIGGSRKNEPAQKKAGKLKPNDPCACGSGKKHKKCCGAI